MGTGSKGTGSKGTVWQELSVVVPRRVAAGLAKRLLALGGEGIQEDFPPGFTPVFRQPWDEGPQPKKPREVVIRTWFRERPAAGPLALALQGAEPIWSERPEEDWAESWKLHFKAVKLPRLTVAPEWEPIPGALLMEPGKAFGTGNHPTTLSCLEAVDHFAVAGERCLDVGCGSGILALAAAKLGMVAEGVDIDPEAVEVAEEMARRNGLPARFSATPVEAVEGTFELVVANLFAEVIVGMAPTLRRLGPRNIALAGILTERAHKVKAAMAGREVLLEREDEGWTALWYGPEIGG